MQRFATVGGYHPYFYRARPGFNTIQRRKPNDNTGRDVPIAESISILTCYLTGSTISRDRNRSPHCQAGIKTIRDIDDD